MVSNGTESNGLNLFSQIREIEEQSLGHVIITSSTFHFVKIEFDSCQEDLEKLVLKQEHQQLSSIEGESRQARRQSNLFGGAHFGN